jgi:hypothetical protein
VVLVVAALGSLLTSEAQAALSLEPAATFATAALPASVAIGDVDGDGKPDLIVVNTGANTVSVFLGSGTGTFGPKTDFATGATPHAVAVADLNGDGNLDLVVANTGADTVSVLLGTGTGTFAAATDFATGAAPFFIAIGDLNGDGIPDLVVVNVNADTVSVLLGLGDGTFGPKTDFATGAGAREVAIGDLNGDGVPDLVVANVSANTVSVFLGTGDGHFSARTDFATGAGARSVAIGDVNGDGILDVVVANVSANTVSVLLGTGTGALGSKTDFATGGGPRAVLIGDVDQDGTLDLVVANFSDNTVSVLHGVGSGSFATKVDFSTGGAGPFSLALGDVNGDGKPDIVAGNVSANSVSVFLNSTPSVLTVTPSTLNFGNVTVGGSADRSFTVTNSGAGTLTGSGTASGAFSVVAGGSYSLGPGQSQTVTVRFHPTVVSIYSGNVSFTSSGGNVSRGVGGVAVNPTPALSSLSPSVTTAGASGFTLTVLGSNFVSSSIVRWNGGSRPTTFVSGTQVQAAIPAGDIAQAGSAQVTVVDPSPGGGTSAALGFTINPAVPSLSSLSPTAATAGGSSFTLAVNGGSFVASSVVRWNGANPTTTFVSSTQLQATIPSTDIALPGSATVTVFTPAPGGGTSGSLTFTITSQTFSLSVTIKGSANGSVTSNLAGISCPGACSAIFPVNVVVLTEAPGTGASFSTWGGGCSGASTSCSVTLNPTSAVTATFSKTFTDGTGSAETISGQGTAIKAAHITELRSAIDTLRSRNGLAAFGWTDPTLTPGVTVVKRVHFIELRTALSQAYQAAGQPAPTFTDSVITAGATVIRAIHLNDLRSDARGLE